MSLKMTTQMEWIHLASYSKFHPDNLERLKPDDRVYSLPDKIVPPPPLASLTEHDKKVRKGWGHTLCCEKPFGPVETTTRIKDNVNPKIGGSWTSTFHFEKGTSCSKSAMYGGSLIEPSFEALVEMRAKKG